MVEKLLAEKISNVLKKLGYEIEAKVVISNRPDLCDYQFDGIFRLAKMYHKSPIEIGRELEEALQQTQDSDLKEISFVVPGFLNITLSDAFINHCLNKMIENPKFNLPEVEHIDTYVIDYGGPNIAKPLHVGHMRPAVVGESIKRIINYRGHKIISDVHFGDFGLQMGQVIYGMKQENISIENVTLKDLDRLYPKMSKLCKEDDSVKEICASITKDLQDGNPEYEEYYKKIFALSKGDIKRIYQFLDVDFDLWYGEMDSRKYIPSVEEVLKEKNILYESEGALVVDIKEEDDSKELPPLIFKKGNGAYLYASADIATIYQREQDFHPDYLLYVADSRQSLHFEQVFRATKKAGITNAFMEHLGFGTVNGEDGKPYKTRSGETPKLEALLREVEDLFVASKESNEEMDEADRRKIAGAILKFADLQNNREKDYIFDIKKFSSVVGKTGPYVLYTYLRIQKILNLEANIKQSLQGEIYNEQDRNLRLKLLELHHAYLEAFETRMPSYIANYVYDLCVELNTFYQNNHISGLKDQEKRANWLTVLTLSNHVVEVLLYLLGIEIPSVM